MKILDAVTEVFFPSQTKVTREIYELKSSSDEKVVNAIFRYLYSKSNVTELPPIDRISKAKDEISRLKLFREIESVFDNKVKNRKEIQSNILLNGLSPYFNLIFLPQTNQLSELLKISLGQVEQISKTQLGTKIFDFVSEQFTNIERLSKDNNILFKDFKSGAAQFTTIAFEKIKVVMGEDQAIYFFKQLFDFIKEVYPYDIAGEFVDILPDKYFDDLKTFLLAQSEVDKRINEAVKEDKNKLFSAEKLYKELKAKSDRIESQNKDLENSKKAILDALEEQKALELKLKEERDRISAIISSMGEGLFVLNEKHQIIMMNPIAEKLLEVNLESVKGKDWTDVVSTYIGEYEIPYVERSTVSSLRAGKVIRTNLEDNHYYLTNSGKKFPIISTTTPLIKDNVVIGVIKVFRDATQDRLSKARVEQEIVVRTKELADEKIKLESSIESIVSAYAFIDRKGEIILTNHQFSDFLGRTETRWTIEKVQERFGSTFDIVSAYKKALNEKIQTKVKEIVFGVKFFEIHINPVLKDTEVLGAVVIIEDITEQKNIDRSKDEFFSIASHELRTPLTAIRGNTAMIQEIYSNKVEDQDFKEMIEDIHESSVRLIGIVNDFLSISRLEMGRMQFKLEKVDLLDLCQGAVQELGASILNKKVKINILPSGYNCFVMADPNKLKEVVINLLGNAMKFTEEGHVDITFEKVGQVIKTRISDTGRGIPIESQKLLFHKFQQASNNILTRDTTKGTGLGLYISKLMVEGMNGQIELEKTEINKGSTFMFTLPQSLN